MANASKKAAVDRRQKERRHDIVAKTHLDNVTGRVVVLGACVGPVHSPSDLVLFPHSRVHKDLCIKNKVMERPDDLDQ